MLDDPLIIRNGQVLIRILDFIPLRVYGCFAFLAVLFFFVLTALDYRRIKLVDFEQHVSIFSWMTMFGIVGARALHVICDYKYFFQQPVEIIKVWDGGLSLMGGIISVIIIAILRLYFLKIPVLEYSDLISTYAPLFQSISRLGCFFAGCCYGLPVRKGLFAIKVIYTNPMSLAELGVVLHATQLYSSIASLCIFVLLFVLSRLKSLRPGTIFFAYLLLEGLSRGFVDFLRGDREIFFIFGCYASTVSQVFAFLLAGFGLIGLLVVSFSKLDKHKQVDS